MVVKKNFAAGGLNTDDDVSVLSPNDYINARNIQIIKTSDGESGLVRPAPGTTAVTDTLPASQDYTVIGKYNDKELNRIYYFVHGSEGDHRIRCYDADAGSIRDVLKTSQVADSSLNFSIDSVIQADKIGDILYFTDNINEPRKINVERGQFSNDFTYTHPDSDTLVALNPSGITSEDLTIIRRPPAHPLDIDEETDTRQNLLQFNAYQFSYRYVYRDNEKSVLAPFSELYNYPDDDATGLPTYLKIKIPEKEKIPYEVQRVEVCFRYGNTGSWFVFDDYNKTENNFEFVKHNNVAGQVMTWEFDNSRSGSAISDEESSKPFSNVPLKSKAIAAAKSRIFLGNNVFGYDTQKGKNITFVKSDIQVNAGSSNVTGQYYGVGWVNNVLDEIQYFFAVKIDEGEDYDGFYLTSLDLPDYETPSDLPDTVTVAPESFLLSNDDYDNDNNDLIRAIEIAVDVDPSENTLEFIQEISLTDVTPTVYGLGTASSIPDNTRIYKSGSRYQFGIVYYDKYLRNAGVATDESWVVNTSSRSYSQSAWTNKVTWIIQSNSMIPSWAHYYQIVRTRNLSRLTFVELFAEEVKYATKDDDGAYTFVEEYNADTVTDLALSIRKLNNEGMGYTYNVGDVAIVYSPDGSTKYELAVTGQYGKWVLVKPVDLGTLDETNDDSVQLCEIYTPRKTENFYEVSVLHRVLNAGLTNRSHEVTAGQIDGDCYIKKRITQNGATIDTEAMNISDNHWSEWLEDIGRTVLVLPDARQVRKENQLVYSATFIQESNVNNLSDFSVLDQGFVDEKNGGIQSLVFTSETETVGNVLLAICKNQTASIYVGQTQVIDDTGDAILATSGNVIGTINNLKGAYGTLHPESVVEQRGFVYWYDAINKEFIRYASNGMMPISNYKVDTICEQIDASGKMPASYDPESDEVLFTVKFSGSAYSSSSATIVNRVYNKQPRVLVDYDGELVLSQVFSSSIAKQYMMTMEAGKVYRVKASNFTNSVAIFWGSSSAAGIPLDHFIYVTENTELYTQGGPGGVQVDVYEATIDEHSLSDYGSYTIAFSELTRRWVSRRDYTAEMMGNLNDGPPILFKDGGVYTLDGTNATYFGTRYKSLIGFVLNEQLPVVKEMQGLTLEGYTAPDFVHFKVEEPYEQSSDIEEIDWDNREGVLYAPVLKDRFTPSASSYVDGLWNGDNIRGQYVYVWIEWDENFELRFTNMKFAMSYGHNQFLVPS